MRLLHLRPTLAGFTSSGAVRITTSGAVLQPASSMPLRSASAPRSDTPAPSDTFPGECLPLNLGLPAIGMGSNGGGGGGGLQPSASASGLHAYVHPTLSPFGSPRRRSRVPSYMPSGANTPRWGAHMRNNGEAGTALCILPRHSPLPYHNAQPARVMCAAHCRWCSRRCCRAPRSSPSASC